jgi:polysaccharide export outer membrane protein
MEVEAYYPKKLHVRLVILLRILALGLLIGDVVECQAQGQGKERRPAPMPAAQSSDESGVTGAIVDVKEDYRISAGDVIEIQVDRAPELSGLRRVMASGSIKMEYLGRMTAQGKTQDELASLIADGLRGRYLKNPHVTVTIKQINSHVFFIQGAVSRPGAYQIEGRPSLMTLIAVAGGLNENHGSTALVIRETRDPEDSPSNENAPQLKAPAAPDPQPEPSAADSLSQSGDQRPESGEAAEFDLAKVNINRLFRGDFDKNIYLEPGSIVHIPQAEVFFVGGEVNAPGSFAYKEGATLRQAILLAQGMKFKAASDRVIIFREDPVTRKRQEIRIDAGKIMNGKQEDVAISANDIVIVPNSMSRSVSGAVLTALGINFARIPIPGY